jgi:hypothetical protein
MYFPNKDEKFLSARKLPTAYDVRYDEISYVRDHLWDNFLFAYYGIEPIIDSLPVVTISSPEYNHTFQNDERVGIVTGEAYDREGIRKVEIRVDDGPWQELPGISGQGTIGWTFYLDLDKLSPGIHSISVRAHDTIGETQPGHVTAPLEILVSKASMDKASEGGSILPSWVVTGMVLAFIVIAFVLGVILLRSRT